MSLRFWLRWFSARVRDYVHPLDGELRHGLFDFSHAQKQLEEFANAIQFLGGWPIQNDELGKCLGYGDVEVIVVHDGAEGPHRILILLKRLFRRQGAH